MKAMNEENKTRISYLLLRVVYDLFEVDKKTRYYGTDKPLFEAEIHMIKAVRENEGIHVTGLAEKLSVTKGAVSQMIMKLQKKGMIIKSRDIHNQSRLMLHLTAKGEAAYLHHEMLHREYDAFINDILRDATEENREFLKGFLVSVSSRLGEFESTMKITN